MKYHIEKSTTIAADNEHVRSFIENFARWSEWSPWTIVEPDCEVIVEGTPGEIGHTMRWKGEIIGSGSQTLSAKNDESLHYDLEFITPFKSKAKASFLFESSDNGTTVTWTMDSKMPFFLFFMVNTMKNLIGMDYERGLKMLKAVAEHGEISATTTYVGVTDIDGFSYVGIKKTVPFAEVGEAMRADFKKLIDNVVHTRGKSAKQWITLYPKSDMRNLTMTYIAAISDEELHDVDLGPEYVHGTIQNGRALEIKHDGPYEFLGNAWSMGMMHLRAKKMKQNGIPFEHYRNSPEEVEAHELKTSVFFPVKD